MVLNWKFWRGQGVRGSNQKPSVGWLWIFSRTTQFCYLISIYSLMANALSFRQNIWHATSQQVNDRTDSKIKVILGFCSMSHTSPLIRTMYSIAIGKDNLNCRIKLSLRFDWSVDEIQCESNQIQFKATVYLQISNFFQIWIFGL